MAEHLTANGVDFDDPKLLVGPWLEMDPVEERFIASDPANSLLTRDYREGYVVTEAPKQSSDA